jgi:phage I-like protein
MPTLSASPLLTPPAPGLAPAAPRLALAAALALPETAAGGAPEWIHLLPAGVIETVDGRGPYRVADMAALAQASLEAGGRLPVDESHATDLAAPQGGPAPARGWIVALEARTDGLWARVEWTEAGKALLSDRAYRHISPVIVHSKAGVVSQVLRASLTNNPNLKRLTALNQAEDTMPLPDKITAALGLKADADGPAALAATLAAIEVLKDSRTALQAVAKAAGLGEGADEAAIVAAVSALADPTKSPTVKALQSEVTALASELKALKDAGARAKSEGVVDAAIAAKKAGVGAHNRDQLVALHQANPAAVEEWLAGLPALGPSGTTVAPPAKDKDGSVALNAAEAAAAKALGLKPEDYKKTLAAERAAAEV